MATTGAAPPLPPPLSTAETDDSKLNAFLSQMAVSQDLPSGRGMPNIMHAATLPAAKPMAMPRKASPWFLIITSLAFALSAIIVLGVIFSIKTPDGELLVDLPVEYADEVSVVVTKGGKSVEIGKKNDWKINLENGEWQIKLQGDETKFEIEKTGANDSVTISKDKKQIVKIVRKENLPLQQVIRSPSIPSNTVDLLALIDTAKHAVHGKWGRRDNVLISYGADNSRIQVPFVPPAEYELRATVKRLAGNNEFMLGLVVHGKQQVLAFDSNYGTRTDLAIEDGKAMDPKNPNLRDQKIFTTGKQHEVVCRVTKDLIVAHVDGKEVFRWRIEPERLGLREAWKMPNERQLFLLTWGDPYEISALTLVPLYGRVDLLAKIDPKRDAIKGTWELKGGKLTSRGAEDALLEIGFEPPPAYEWRARIKRLSGVNAGNFGLVIGDRQVQLGLDTCDGKRTGLATVDGHPFRDTKNPTVRELTVLKTDVESELVCRVSPEAIWAAIDGKEIVSWTGDNKRLGIFDHSPFSQLKNKKHLFLSAWTDPVEFSSLTVRPIDPKDVMPVRGELVDLLPLIDPAKHAVTGEWAWQDKVLTCKGADNARIQVPFTPPRSYELRAKIRRIAGGECVNLGIVIDGRHACLGLDAYTSTLSGISNINNVGFDIRENGSGRRLSIFKTGQITEVVCRVKPGEVHVTADGREVIHWSGDPNRISMPKWFAVPNPLQLSLGTHTSPIEFHSLTLRPIHPDEVSPTSGLNAEYFADANFSQPVLTRRDPVVDFHWREGSPDPMIPNDIFSVRWQGWIKAPKAGKYRFFLYADERASLFIDDKLAVATEELRSAPYEVEVPLTDQPHRIRIEHLETKGAARISLRWSHLGEFPLQVIPSDALFTTMTAAKQVKVVLPEFNNTDKSAEPFVLQVEGVPGIKELRPEGTPPETWREPGVFARINGGGELRYPSLALRNYVIEWRMRIDAVAARVNFRGKLLPTRPSAEFFWEYGPGTSNTNSYNVLFQDHNGTGQWWWNGSRTAQTGDTYKMKLIAAEGVHRLVFNDVAALGISHSPGECQPSIEVEWGESLITIFDAKVRPLQPEDMKWVGATLPASSLLPRATTPVIEQTIKAGETVDLTERIKDQLHDEIISGYWSSPKKTELSVGNSAIAALRLPIDLRNVAEYKLSFQFEIRGGNEAIQTVLPAHDRYFVAVVNGGGPSSGFAIDPTNKFYNRTKIGPIKLEPKKPYDYEAHVRIENGKLSTDVYVTPIGEKKGKPYLALADQDSKSISIQSWLSHVARVIDGSGCPAFQTHFTSGVISNVKVEVIKGQAQVLKWVHSPNTSTGVSAVQLPSPARVKAKVLDFANPADAVVELPPLPTDAAAAEKSEVALAKIRTGIPVVRLLGGQGVLGDKKKFVLVDATEKEQAGWNVQMTGVLGNPIVARFWVDQSELHFRWSPGCVGQSLAGLLRNCVLQLSQGANKPLPIRLREVAEMEQGTFDLKKPNVLLRATLTDAPQDFQSVIVEFTAIDGPPASKVFPGVKWKLSDVSTTGDKQPFLWIGRDATAANQLLGFRLSPKLQRHTFELGAAPSYRLKENELFQALVPKEVDARLVSMKRTLASMKQQTAKVAAKDADVNVTEKMVLQVKQAEAELFLLQEFATTIEQSRPATVQMNVYCEFDGVQVPLLTTKRLP